ncbi:MAG: protein kinase [Planctomycetes bacterium]|nr:protein kinase [Planctomycetota bacterium]
MPAPATVSDFLELVRKSGLVPEAKLDELLGRHRETGTPQTVDQTAAALVRDAQLTFFQAKQLKLGRYKRFTIGAKYRLLELSGAGGMGAVYLCEHTLMKRLVALKVLPGEKLDDQSNLDRFYREARAVAALDHPNIVRAYDIDQYEKLHFLVMEYVDGSSLQEIIARYATEKKQFDPVRAAHYIAQAAVGMQHAHELGMVHRDIKPGNLLLDRTGVIKVLDMGLARFFNKQQDNVTEKYDDKCVLGTADYLAPEQAVSNVVDVRADIYSLGGTLYFMLTGQTPFPDGTIAAKLVAHRMREPQPVESFRSDVPAGVLAVLRKMLAKEPADRYQEPIEVAEALAEWANRPIAPPPDREMPALCPLVQALMAPTGERSGSTPLARALFAPGRGVFSRPGGSSAQMAPRPDGSKSGSGATASSPAFPASAKSVPRYAPGGDVSVGGAISTSRASTSPTSPLPVNGTSGGSELTKGKVPVKPRPRPLPRPAAVPGPRAAAVRPARRVWLFVGIGTAVVALFAAGAFVAYEMGRGRQGTESPATNPDPVRPPADVPGPGDPVPGAADKLVTPAQAAQREGEEQTVEFKVQSAGGSANLYLNSEADFHSSDNFAVRVSADYFKTAGAQSKTLFEQTKKDFEGKTIRARGKVQRDASNKGLFIEVRTPRQILVVAER